MAIRVSAKVGETVFDGVTLKAVTPRILMDKKSMTFAGHASIKGESELLYSRDFHAPYSLSAGNPFEQAYGYLKTLPEFEDAIDC